MNPAMEIDQPIFKPRSHTPAREPVRSGCGFPLQPFEELAVQSNPGSRTARGMYFTVTCSEGVRFITDQEVVKETQGTFVGPAAVMSLNKKGPIYENWA